MLIASRSAWKAQLFGPIFRDYGFKIISLNDIQTPLPDPVEDGRTVLENALIKARHYHSSEFPWVFGDDMGLEIDALNGEPGVQTRRWGGRFSDDVEDQVWLDYLLNRMQDVPTERRTAHFVDGWALLTPEGGAYTREIRAPFEISWQPIRPMMPGSPIAAVAIGFPDSPEQALAQARARWNNWGILDTIANR